MIYDDHDTSHHNHMSLDRPPTNRADGSWSSPGLTSSSNYGGANGDKNVSWASAQAGSARVNGYAIPNGQAGGFFKRNMRRLSESLPYFSAGEKDDRFAEKEKLQRSRAPPSRSWQDLPKRMGLLASRRRKILAGIVLAFVVLAYYVYPREC